MGLVKNWMDWGLLKCSRVPVGDFAGGSLCGLFESLGMDWEMNSPPQPSFYSVADKKESTQSKKKETSSDMDRFKNCVYILLQIFI